MVRMFVRHEVADYATWREAYDSIDQDRQKMGFASQDEAHSFASSTMLRDAMQRAGVQGQPEIWFTTAA